jgi:hypothetical protein
MCFLANQNLQIIYFIVSTYGQDSEKPAQHLAQTH